MPRPPKLLAPPEELVQYLESSVPWEDVAAELGYPSPRKARMAALSAAEQVA